MDFTTSENFDVKVETIEIKNDLTSNEVGNDQLFEQIITNLFDFGRRTGTKIRPVFQKNEYGMINDPLFVQEDANHTLFLFNSTSNDGRLKNLGELTTLGKNFLLRLLFYKKKLLRNKMNKILGKIFTGEKSLKNSL